jgi:DNA-directed RNA polymerase subunit alpha
MDTPATAVFAAPTLTAAVADRALDAAHATFRARESFETALKEYAASASGGDAALRVGLGWLALGKYSEAIERLQKAGGDTTLRAIALADAYTAMNRFADARAVLTDAAGKSDDALGLEMRIAELLIREGDFAGAAKLIKKHEARGADRGEWYYAQAILAEAELRREEAYELYHKALKLLPDEPRVLFRAAYLFDLVGSDDIALELYTTLTQRPRARVNALINMAVIHEDRGEYEEAAECLRRVLKAYPNHHRARLFLKDVESGIELIAEEGRETRTDPRQRLLNTPIADFELSVRARNCLKKMNIRTLGELIKLTEPELLVYKNFGETSLNEIKALLARKGLRLGMQPEEVDADVLTQNQPVADPAKPAAPKINLPPGREDLLSKPVSDLELSVRSRRCLQRLSVSTIGDLLNYTEADLLATRNFGQTSLNEIRAKLAVHGLTLQAKR